jgi:hypothetical protein
MKKSFIFLMLGFVVFVCLPVTPASGDQWDITVPDAGFDDHVLANPGDYIDIVDSKYDVAWECITGDAWVDYLYWANNGYPEDLVALSGNNKAYANGDQIYQILDETFIAGGTYTLSVWVGQPWTGGRSWLLYFTDEDYTNNLAEASGTAPETWGQVSLVYTATAADAFKKIGIKMGGNEDVAFEDVTLSYDGPPRLR